MPQQQEPQSGAARHDQQVGQREVDRSFRQRSDDITAQSAEQAGSEGHGQHGEEDREHEPPSTPRPPVVLDGVDQPQRQADHERLGDGEPARQTGLVRQVEQLAQRFDGDPASAHQQQVEKQEGQLGDDAGADRGPDQSRGTDEQSGGC